MCNGSMLIIATDSFSNILLISMHQAKAVLKAILAYITLKSGCIQHKPKCTKNAGIRLVVPKTVGSNPISHPSAERAHAYRGSVYLDRDF